MRTYQASTDGRPKPMAASAKWVAPAGPKKSKKCQGYKARAKARKVRPTKVRRKGPTPAQVRRREYTEKALADGGLWLFGRLWVKNGDYYIYKRKLSLHNYIYKMSGGYKKPGWHVHHCDINTENNSFDNLIALPKELHVHIHNLIRANANIPLTKPECQHLLDLLQSGYLQIPKKVKHGVGKKRTPKNVCSNAPQQGIVADPPTQ